MTRSWTQDLQKFEHFLRCHNLKEYSHLRHIKTVEQNLPRELLPLEIIYDHYWANTDFLDYDELFSLWRENSIDPIYRFMKKYFYGCSIQFVEEGFRARLYRIWMSLLTQFHFQYLWNSLFSEKIASTPEWDFIGVDGIVTLKNKKVAIQIKKVSYRREASQRRFTSRQRKLAHLAAEVPYLVVDATDLQNKITSPRTREKTKEKCQSLLRAFRANFTELKNGFVIFKEEYLRRIKGTLEEKLPHLPEGETISYENFLIW